MRELDFEADLYIDKFSLDEEWRKQPLMVMMYGEELAEQSRVLDDLKLTLKVLRAEKALEIRSGNYPNAPAKITEGTVSETVDFDKDVIDAQKKINEQKEVVDKLSAAVDAFQHRKHALIKESELWMAGFYGEPRSDKNRSDLNRMVGKPRLD